MNTTSRNCRLLGTVITIAVVAKPLPLGAAWYFNAPTHQQPFTTTQDIGCGGFTDHANETFTLVCKDSGGNIERGTGGQSGSMFWSATLFAGPWTADATGQYHTVEVSGVNVGGTTTRQVKINP